MAAVKWVSGLKRRDAISQKFTHTFGESERQKKTTVCASFLVGRGLIIEGLPRFVILYYHQGGFIAAEEEAVVLLRGAKETN